MGEFEDFADPQEYHRDDPATDQAKDRLRALFDAEPKRVFYSRQLETFFEKDLFHWITARALADLSASGEIQRIQQPVGPQTNPVNFFAHRGHRYVRREIISLSKLLARIFDPDFTHAVGQHGELMFDAAFARYGFTVDSANAKSWQGVDWTTTNHNLDRIVSRDGRTYGVEIKNTQNYIDRDELETKLELCAHLGLTPLFLMRYAPKTYIHTISQPYRGFALLFEHQLYPYGHTPLLQLVQGKLGLKVHSPRDVPDSHITRFVSWHTRQLTRPAR
jgi:hypothetical protein